MNASEQIAYEWLLERGYSAEDIEFRSNQTPDFIASDGKAFEVKLLYGTTMRFTAGQVEKLLAHERASVLAVKDGEVVGEVEAFRLGDRPKTVGGFKVAYMESFVSVSVERETAEKVKAMVFKTQAFGWANLPKSLHKHFTDGVTNSAIIDAALSLLEEMCRNDREPSAG